LPRPAATHLFFLTCQETKTAFDPAALLQHRETQFPGFGTVMIHGNLFV
jgi:hypothetical protein